MTTLGIVLSVAISAAVPELPPQGKNAPQQTEWRNHNCLKNDRLKTYWSFTGSYRIEGVGLHLFEGTGMNSSFKLVDGSTITIEYVANQQNLFLSVCGQTIELSTVRGKRMEETVIRVRRKSHELRYCRHVNRALVDDNKILLASEKVRAPSAISFHCERAKGANGLREHNSYVDMTIQKIHVSGPVIAPAGD